MSNQTLDTLQQFITECNQSNSINDKIEVLKKYPNLQNIFAYIYDKVKYTYGITSDKINKLQNDPKVSCVFPRYTTIEELLDGLNNKEVTGHKAVGEVLAFINSGNEQYRQLIYNILDRNIQTRTTATLINRIYPGCISSSYVALARDINDYDPDRTKIDLTQGQWWVSRKLDGVRCTVLIDNNGDCRVLSRSGQEYKTLSKLTDELKLLNLRNVALDGECCIVENGVENFQKMMEVIRRKDYTIPNPRYYMFDMINLDDFLRYHSDEPYSSRYNRLMDTFAGKEDVPYYRVLPQIWVSSWKQVAELEAEASKNGWEGLILRNDSPHDEGRSNNMLKLKKFYDAEFIVKDVEMGPLRIIKYDENGKSYEATEEMLSAVMIEYKGSIVRVGSGFSTQQRQEFYKDPSKIIGKQICVKYFEVSQDKNGKYSLRFPTVKAIYDTPRNGI